ncbi:hypothetical protein PSP31121_05348 [Pandoraea sputorum]|uniref:Gamma-soluble NSF attachment protein n=1 Tax=Pandoraea sputorum TaxID=93222 RepID=A0A5E5BK75_9BURK|nr:hypothetical protein PSP31121_05348 [Pandoraea sputorum]
MYFPKELPTPVVGPHLPAESAEAHGSVSAMLAALDFSDAQAVHAAHLSLQTQAPVLFPAHFFDGVDPDGVARALATGILEQGAAQQQQTTQGIAPGPEQACRTLSEHFTPSGQDALLQSLENSHAENAFSKYLAATDRHCLAGHLWLQRANTRLVGGDIVKTPEVASAQAAEDYLKAADHYRRAGQTGPAADAYRLAAVACLRTYQPLKAAKAFLQAAGLLTQTQQLPEAENARRQALAAYLNAANGCVLAGAPAPAVDAYLNAVELCIQTHRPVRALDACLKAADACLRAKRPLKAASVYLKAVGLCNQTIDLYTQTRQPLEAVDACRKAVHAARRAAVIYTKRRQPALVAEANSSAAEAYRRLGFCLKSANKPSKEVRQAFRSAARLYVEVGAYKPAALVFSEARDWPQAGRCYERLKMFGLAGHCYKNAKMFKEARHAFWTAQQQSQNPIEKRDSARMAGKMSIQADLAEALSDQNL